MKVYDHDFDFSSIGTSDKTVASIKSFVSDNKQEIENLLSSNDGSMEKLIQRGPKFDGFGRDHIIGLINKPENPVPQFIREVSVPVINSLYDKNNVYTAMIVLLDGLKSEVEQLKNNEGGLVERIRSGIINKCPKYKPSENILLDIFKCITERSTKKTKTTQLRNHNNNMASCSIFNTNPFHRSIPN